MCIVPALQKYKSWGWAWLYGSMEGEGSLELAFETKK